MTKNQAINLMDGYQQALEDFAITPLITRLKTYSDADFEAVWVNLSQPELESLAAILIRELTTNLNGKAIAGYLNALRHGSTDIPPSLVHLAFPPPSIDLPVDFPNVQTPRYLYGDKLRWIPDSDKTDWGIAIGTNTSLISKLKSRLDQCCSPKACQVKKDFLVHLLPQHRNQ